MVEKIYSLITKIGRLKISPLIIILTFLLVSFTSPNIEAKGLAAAAEKAATRRILRMKSVNVSQKLGKLHTFKKDTKLIHFSDHPKLDKKMGLRAKSYWTRSKPGRIGSPQHVQNKLAINHPLKGKEEIVAKKGWKYYERPIKNGQAHVRETIVMNHIKGKDLSLTGNFAR